jgi:hypothetical protein
VIQISNWTGVERGFIVVVLAALLGVSSLQGALSTVDVPLSDPLSGVPPVSSAKPWTEALFQDINSTTVRLTITAPNLTDPELMSELFLNFTDAKKVNKLDFQLAGQSSVGTPTVKEGKNSFTAPGGGAYDILIGFPVPGGQAQQFNPGDTVVFTITAPFPISSLDFAQRSQATAGDAFYAVAGIATTSDKNGNANKNSGYIDADSFTFVAVPEFASGLLASVVCLLGLIWSTGKRLR